MRRKNNHQYRNLARKVIKECKKLKAENEILRKDNKHLVAENARLGEELAIGIKQAKIGITIRELMDRSN